jgi:hypothetical protein
MGTVTALRSEHQGETLGDAIGAYLASIDRPEHHGQHKQYAATQAGASGWPRPSPGGSAQRR